ncbi:MAG TPA: proliferating cell nuclear antigen (pcna) [Candidatus Deferrimicrobium sp.]|nr:proliferating cell nuclear antigen (pcna) [Candidatus Deferrimicrobium sp.]
MFEASLDSAGILIKIIDALATIIDIATFKVSSAGLTLKAMDPSHVAMVNLELPKSAFKEFKSDKTLPIRINLTDLNRFMKRGSAGDALDLSLDQKLNKLKLKFKSGKSTRTFSLNLLTEEEEEESPTPSLDFNAKLSLNTADLQRAIKDAQIVGDFITFSLTEEVLTLEASGDSGNVTIEVEDFIDRPSVKEKQSSMYSLEYLADIIKASSFAGTVNIEFSSEMPIKFEFPIDPEGKITYLLAPRVEEEEEEYEGIEAEEADNEEDALDEDEAEKEDE